MSLPDPGPDRAAVVTGASSGIGAAIARELCRRGQQVVLIARSADKLTDLAEELGEAAHVLPADLSDRPSRAGLFYVMESMVMLTFIVIKYELC